MTLTQTRNIFFQGLNPQQLEAAQITEGPVATIAIVS